MMPVDIRVIYLPQKANSSQKLGLRKIASRRLIGMTDTHTIYYDPGAGKVPGFSEEAGRR
jgi:hypothetical protein